MKQTNELILPKPVDPIILVDEAPMSNGVADTRMLVFVATVAILLLLNP